MGEFKMPFGRHLIESRKLMEIRRYQNMFCHKKRSVSEHMWSVAKTAEGLAIWEQSKFKNEVNMGILLEKAINHDLIEQSTGDILGPTKKRTKAMAAAVAEIEEIAYREEIEKDLPMSWREPFRKMILNPKTSDIEGQILRAADTIDTMIEAIEEIKLGNIIFKKVLIESSECLVKVNLDSVRYFIKYALDDFELDIKEYFGEVIFKLRDGLKFDDTVFKASYRLERYHEED